MVADRLIQTARLTLRRPRLDDADLIVEALSDGTVCSAMPILALPYRLQDAHAFISHVTTNNTDDFLVFDEDGLAGSVALVRELGYWLSPNRWGRGYACEAATALIDRHFTSDAACVFSSHNPSNGRSQRVLDRLGFQHTGEVTRKNPRTGASMTMVTRRLDREMWRTA